MVGALMTEDRTREDALTLVLEVARKLILPATGWTKGCLARSAPLADTETFLCDPRSSYASCYCGMGAIRAAVHRLDESLEAEGVSINDADQTVLSAFNALHGTGHETLFDANDDPNTTHEMVIAAFDHAIRELG